MKSNLNTETCGTCYECKKPLLKNEERITVEHSIFIKLFHDECYIDEWSKRNRYATVENGFKISHIHSNQLSNG